MLISDRIAQLIEAMLRENGGTLEIRRNDMAERIGCSPSQINYVMTSRFSPEHGYLIESRRGGGGYVRIVQKRFPGVQAHLMHSIVSLGSGISEQEAFAYLRALHDARSIRADTAAVMRAALSTLPSHGENGRRADLFRRMLLALSD